MAGRFGAFADKIAQEREAGVIVDDTSLFASPAAEAGPVPADLGSVPVGGAADDGSIILEPVVVEAARRPREFRGYAERVDRERRGGLRQALYNARNEDPDAYAAAQAEASRLGMPAEVYLRNKTDLQGGARLADMEAILGENPALAQWASQGDNAAYLKVDDLRGLSGLSWLWSAGGEAFKAGSQDARLGNLRFRQLSGIASEAEITEADAISEGQTNRTFAADSWLEQSWVALGRQIPMMAETIGQGFARGTEGAATGMALGAVAGSAAGGVGAGPGAVAGFGVGYTTGTAVGAFEAGFKLEAGLAYDEFKAIEDEAGNPLDDGVARSAAVLAGAVNGGLEVVGMRAFLGRIPGVDRVIGTFGRDAIGEALKNPGFRSALTRATTEMAKGAAVEISTEMGQELVTALSGELAKVASEGEFDAASLSEISERVIEGGIEAAKVVTLLGPLGAGARFTRDMHAARTAERREPQLQALGDEAKSNGLVQRAPEKAREAVAASMGENPTKLYMDGGQLVELFQSRGIDPYEMERVIPGWSQELLESVAAGTDIEIDAADLYAHIAPLEAYADLVPHLKTAPDDLSADQARAFNEAWAEAREELVNDEARFQEEDRVISEPSVRVGEDVYEKAVAAGIAPDQARTMQTFYGSFFRTLSERTGEDAFETYNAYGFEIARALPEELRYVPRDGFDVMLDSLRKGRALGNAERSERRARGKSLLEFVADRGGMVDTGGELEAMDAKSWRRGRALASEITNERGLDSTARAAWEAGYFGDVLERPSTDDLLNLVREELAGRPTYAGQDGALPSEQALMALAAELDQAGLVLDEMTNEEIRAELDRLSRDPDTDALYQMAGIRAQNADLSDLDTAQTMESEGRDADEIFEETGFFRGVDGGWRFEIVDTEAEFILPNFAFEDGADRGVGTLADFLKHDRLFQAYPQLRALPVDILIDDTARPGGVYAVDPIRGGEIEVRGTTEKEARSILLHEIAHAIQDIEGFANGGNTTMGELYEGAQVDALTSQSRALAVQIGDAMAAGDWPRMDELNATRSRLNASLTAAARYEYYRRIAGEVEARNVQERDRIRQSNGEGFLDELDPGSPVWTQDVPNDQVIIVRASERGKGYAAAAERPEGLEDIIARGRAAGLDIAASERGGDITLSKIVVPEERRGEGLGSSFMRELTGFADRNARRVILTPSGDFGGSVPRLKRFYKGFDFAENKGRSRDFSTREGMIRDPQEPSRELFQSVRRSRRSDLAGEQARQDKRGSIQFGEGRTVINLFDKADLSTMLHESGHFFLEVYRDTALRTNNETVKADWEKLKALLGQADDGAITTDAHEKFAQSFESYLFEGRAPSDELRSIFSRFRSWLVFVYRSIKNLGGPIDPEMREIMDRMLASDEAIEATRRQGEYRPLFGSAADAGVSDAEYEGYAKAAQRAVDQAKNELEGRLLDEIARENRQAWREAKREKREEVKAEFSAMPVYQAFEFMRSGKFIGPVQPAVEIGQMRMDRDTLVRTYGEGVLTQLPRAVPPIYAKDGGASPDIIADIFGFKSGDEMISALLSSPPLGRAINEEVERRMRAEYGDLLGNQDQLATAAMEALHSDERGIFIATELKVLAKRGGKSREAIPANVASRTARDLIAGKTVAQAGRVSFYAAAERKAAREAEASMLAGRFAAAAEAKRRQLFTHYLALESKRASREIDSAVAYLSKFSTKRPEAIDAEYVDRIQQMLERFDMRRGVSMKAIRKRESLASWVAQQEADGETINLPPDLLNEAYRQHYKTMTLEDLRALRDAVKNLEHVGRLKGRLMDKRARLELAAVSEDLAAVARRNNAPRVRKSLMRNLTPKEKLGENVLGLAASLVRIEQVVEWLDGGDINGPWRKRIFQPMSDAQNVENDMLVRYTDKMTNIIRAVPNQMEVVHIPEVGESFHRHELMAVALNVGNASNRFKLVEGEKRRSGSGRAIDTEDKLEAILSRLTKQEWDAVQQVWDTINSLWPQIQAIEKRLTGVEPPKVEAVEVRTKFGTYAGGYYPLVYDPRFDAKVAQRQEEAADKLFENTYMRPDTERGFTKARNEKFARPIRFDMDAAANHIANVIHDFTHREAIRNVHKVMQQEVVQAAVSETMGQPILAQFNKWLQRVANDRRSQQVDGWDRFFQKTTTNATVFFMGFRWSTVVMQFTGFAQSLDMVSPRYMGPAMAEFMRDAPRNMFSAEGGELVAFVEKRSGEMRHRMNTMDRDIRTGLREATGEDGMLPAIRRAAFYGIGYTDRFISMATWKAAYDQQLVKTPRDEEAAIAFADRVVRLTQGAGSAKDISAFQAKPGATRLFTMFYSYFNAYLNRMWTLGRDTNRAVREARYQDFPSLIGRMIALTIIPAVVGDLMVGRGPSEEDDESYLSWVLGKVAVYPFAGIPVVRDVASAMESGFGYNLSPVERVFENIVKLPNDVSRAASGEASIRVPVKRALETGAMIGGVPVGEPMRLGNNIWQGLEEGDLRASDLIFPRGQR